MKSIIIVCLFILSINVVYAVNKTYVGPTTGGNWLTASNWSPAGVPANGDDVIIPAGKTVVVNTTIGGAPRSLTVYGIVDLTDNGKLEILDVVFIGPSPADILGDSQNDKLRVKGVDYINTAITALSGQVGVVPTNFPVKILSFETEKFPNSINLTWKVAQETDFKKYVIEKANNAISFEAIASIENINFEKYSFEDKFPLIGNNYYRLKLVNQDDTYTYSKIISIDFSRDNDISIFPNPAQNNQIEISNINENVNPELFNSSGQKIEFRMINNGSKLFIIPNTNQNGQLLLLRIKRNNKVKTERLIMEQ